MEENTISWLVNSDLFLLFEAYVRQEVKNNKEKAFQSISTDKIDIESANRAKFYEECINIPRNLLAAKKMNKNKTNI